MAANLVDECMAVSRHEEFKSDRVKWSQLPSRGLQDDGDGGAYELKNCPHCASTMAVAVGS